jgi:hypothetical protein
MGAGAHVMLPHYLNGNSDKELFSEKEIYTAAGRPSGRRQ